MAVENPGYFHQLNPNWPTDQDPCPEGDNHIRVIKASLQFQFPNLGTSVPVNPTAAELNYLVGVTSSIQNQLDALASAASSIPVGGIMEYGGSVAPGGFVFCDFSAYDGTNPTFAALWNVIGNTYGGTGITDFRVPDFRGRSPIGVGAGDASYATGWNRGEKSGAEKHALTAAENGPHTHTLNNADRQVKMGGANTREVSGADVDADEVTITVNSSGSGTPHNITHPVLGVHFIIKL